MNVWLWGATGLLVGLVPCGWVALRATRVDAVVGLQTAASVTTLVLLLLAEGFQRPTYMTLPLALAFLNVVGTLIFARFLGRHL